MAYTEIFRGKGQKGKKVFNEFKAVFIRSIKIFVHRAFFVSLMYAGNFLFYAEIFYAQNAQASRNKNTLGVQNSLRDV